MKSNSCTHSIRSLNWSAFFMNQQYHVAKRTKGLSDFVWLCLLYVPLKPNPGLSHSPISVVRHSSSVKALKIYVPDFFFTFLPLKGTVSCLPTLQCYSCSVFPSDPPHPIFDSALILFFFFENISVIVMPSYLRQHFQCSNVSKSEFCIPLAFLLLWFQGRNTRVRRAVVERANLNDTLKKNYLFWGHFCLSHVR